MPKMIPCGQCSRHMVLGAVRCPHCGAKRSKASVGPRAAALGLFLVGGVSCTSGDYKDGEGETATNNDTSLAEDSGSQGGSGEGGSAGGEGGSSEGSSGEADYGAPAGGDDAGGEEGGEGSGSK